MTNQRVLLPLIGPVDEPRLEPVPGVDGKFNVVMAWRPDLLAAFFDF